MQSDMPPMHPARVKSGELMDFVHLHLMASHVPVIGVLLLLPLFAYALIRKSDELAKTGLWGLVLTAVAAVTVYLSGEPTEEGVESIAGISKAMIEQHEEVALVATILLGAVGILALVALFRSRKARLPRGIVVAALLSTLGVTGAFAMTANLGGKIRHSEITSGATTSTAHEVDAD
jgi:beta-lactamase regulating signal transducer with metallopeptidase domain